MREPVMETFDEVAARLQGHGSAQRKDIVRVLMEVKELQRRLRIADAEVNRLKTEAKILTGILDRSNRTELDELRAQVGKLEATVESLVSRVPTTSGPLLLDHDTPPEYGELP